ncbi:MAG: DUF4403 family protein [Flavobacterium sp.]
MHKTLLNIILFILILTISGCSTSKKIDALKPEPDNASPLLYEDTPSFIGLPVSIKISEVENQINKQLNGLIFNDPNIEDDNISIQVWKQAPIVLTNKNGKLRTVLPLKATIKYRYGIDKFGVSIYDTRELNLNGNINLVSAIKLNNWKINTATEFESLNWNESPTINIGGKSIPITYLADSALKYFKSKIEKSIDQGIEKAINFKPDVLNALAKLSQPTLVNSQYQTWFQIIPTELYSSDVVLKKDDITMNLGMKCNIATFLGQKPTNEFNKNQLPLKSVSKIPGNITINMVGVSSYNDASKILAKNFNDKEFVFDGKRKIKVQNVGLWHKKGKMVISMAVTGSVNGTIYLTGVPQFDNKTQEIYFDQLDYVLDTKSKLLRTANWMVSGLIIKKIEENCRYSIKSNIEEEKQTISKYLKNYSPMPGVFVNGTLGNISFIKTQLTNNAIIAFMTITGDANVTVKSLNF